MKPERAHGRPGRGGRSAARLAAVQALYQMEITAAETETVIGEFVAHRFAPDAEMGRDEQPEPDFFVALVRGVPARQQEIDRAIARSLATGWRLSRIDSILRAILRAGTYELLARPDIPAKTAITEYVQIAHAFLAGEEAKFVNAVLDRIAREARGPELEGAAPNGTNSA